MEAKWPRCDVMREVHGGDASHHYTVLRTRCHMMVSCEALGGFETIQNSNWNPPFPTLE
jgi:hypothetical protein